MSVALIFLFLMLFSIVLLEEVFVMKFVFRLGKKSEPLCFEGETLKPCQNFASRARKRRHNKHTKKDDGQVYALFSEQPRGGFGVRYPGEEETERGE